MMDSKHNHSGWDIVNYACNDTSYEDDYFVDAKSPVVLDGNSRYYVDSDGLECYNVSTGKTNLKTSLGYWYVWKSANTYWNGTYSGLWEDDGKLFYNTSTAIMYYDIASGKTETFFTPDTSTGYIYGSMFENGKIYYSLQENYNVDFADKDLYYIPHAHSKGTHHDAVAATCVDKGSIEYWSCKTCDAELDKDGKVVSDITTAIDSSNHVGDTEIKNALQETCGKDGYTGDTYCKSCKELITKGSTIKATGNHSWDKGTVTTTPTEASEGVMTYKCTVCDTGKKTEPIAKLNHEKGTYHAAIAATCIATGSIEYWDCKNCNGKLDQDCKLIDDIITAIDPANHVGDTEIKNALQETCGKDGYSGDTYCKSCTKLISNGSVIKATGKHSWDKGTVTTTPTEKQEGVMTYKCTVCDIGEKTEPISKLTHEKGTYHAAIAATCISTGSAEYWDCKNCDGMLDKDCKIITDLTTPVDSSNHVGDTEVVNAFKETCGKDGYTGDTYCKSCSNLISNGSVIKATGKHTWDAGRVTKAASCTEEGTMTYNCTVCDQGTKTEKIAKLPHEKGTYHEAIKATCVSTGSLEYWECKNCGCKLDKDGKEISNITTEKDPSNHNNAATIVKNAKEATTSAAGYTGDKCCSACGAILEKGTAIAKKNDVVLPSQASSDNPISQDTSGLIGTDSSVLDSKIAATKSDEIKGSIFQLLQLRSKKVAATSLTIQWKKVSGATSYVVYGAKCGSKFTKLAVTKSTSYTNKKLTKGKYYKYFVVALKGDSTLATSKTIHLATSGGKVGNIKSISLNKSSLSLKAGKKFTLKATVKPASAKLTVKKHRALAYESSDKSIATVSSKGVITAKKKGTCYVYAYTQSGIFAKVKVTVK